jgi:hypothetical protein
MRTGRPKQPLIVTEEEQDRLQSLAHRARSQSLLARRDSTTTWWRNDCVARPASWASGVPASCELGWEDSTTSRARGRRARLPMPRSSRL